MAKSNSGKGDTTYMKPMLSRKEIMINNFIGGIFWALGSILGIAVIAVILTIVLNVIDFKLILGEWLGGIIKDSLSQIDSTKK